MDRISINYDTFKPSPSMYSHIEHLKKYILNKDILKDDNPYFAYIHVDDIHTPEMFFSYDSVDMDILSEEFEALENFLSNLPKNYKGALSYDYALVYVDLCIKRLVNWLKDNGKMNNTTIVITADHGFSFSYDPIRKNAVNNFYDENYRIPFIIFDKDSQCNKIEKFASSTDIIPTLLDYLNLPKEDNLRGKSLLSNYTRDFITMEYMGSGCPDLKRRDIKYCIRSIKYKIVYSVNINAKFNEGKLLELYDLDKDPFNYTNIRDKITKLNDAKQLLSILKARHEELQENYSNISEFTINMDA